MSLKADAALGATARPKQQVGWVDRTLRLLSSVRFGIVLLMLMILLCMTGMLIMQINVDGFDKYFATLTPSQKILYTDPILRILRNITGLELRGWNILSLVDIYKSYVFITLLAILSLNIILASLDYFPGAWRYITRKKLTASRPYVKRQMITAVFDSDGATEEIDRIVAACTRNGFTPTVTHEETRTTVFAERGAWNRLGAYFVHVGLLTIFLAGFLSWRTMSVGSMTLEPGDDAQAIQALVYDLDKVQVGQFGLPFVVECTDIQQTLLDKNGSLDASNTVDWFTRVRIVDASAGKTTEAEIHMNKPFDYRGYRFFQSSYQNIPRARTVTVRAEREGGEPTEFTIQLNQSTTMPDGTAVTFASFAGDPKFANGSISDGSMEYRNPVAFLRIQSPGQQPKQALAFTPNGLAGASQTVLNATTVDGVKYSLVDYEKVGQSHTLSVQYDQGAWVFYLGSSMLVLALMLVFFFSHQRIWFVLETDKDGKRKLFVGGNTNRNRLGLERNMKTILAAILPAAGSAQSEGVKV